MENKEKRTKITKWFAIGAIAFLAIIILIIAVSPDEITESQTETSEEVVATSDNSENLLNYLLENSNLKDGMNVEIEKFDDRSCIVWVTVPEDMGKTGADVVGTGYCTLAVQWLSQNGFDLDGGDLIVRCSVVSPHVGVTGKEGMVTLWGRARYDRFSDTVKWEWEKS